MKTMDMDEIIGRVQDLRVMRDYVYGQRSTDNNWNHCGPMWVKDWDFIKEFFAKLPRPLPRYEDLPWPKIA